MPDPSATRVTVADAVTNAPAKIEGHDAADFPANGPASIATAVPAIIVVSSMTFT